MSFHHFLSPTYFSARNRLSQVLVIGAVIIVITVSWAALMPIIEWVKAELSPRMSSSESLKNSVVIDIPNLNSDDFEEIRARPQRVLVYQTKPTLELIGRGVSITWAKPLGSSSTQSSSRPGSLTVGVFPKYVDRVFRVDSVGEFLVESPSMMLLLRDLLFSARGEAIRAELIVLKEEVSTRWQRIWPLLTTSLSQHLRSQDLAQITGDPVIISRIKQSLMNEIQTHIEFEGMGARLAKLPEVNELVSLATEEMNITQLREKTVKGLLTQTHIEAKRSKRVIVDLWREDRLLSDSTACLFKGAKRYHWGAKLLGYIYKTDHSRLCTSLSASTSRTLVGGLRAGGEDFVSQAWERAYEQRERSTTLGVEAAGSIAKELKVRPVLHDFWSRIKSDEQLYHYVKTKYGESTWRRLSNALRSFAAQESVRQELRELSDLVERAGKKTLGALVLDAEGKGPNPLLITLIKEEISRERRPVVWVTPGESSSKIGSGHHLQRPSRGSL